MEVSGNAINVRDSMKGNPDIHLTVVVWFYVIFETCPIGQISGRFWDNPLLLVGGEESSVEKRKPVQADL